MKAGSGALTFGNPTSAGVPEELVAHTLVLDYNDTQQLEDAFARHGAQTKPAISSRIFEVTHGGRAAPLIENLSCSGRP